jgi:imidazolonepropionase-like amidohydrolase
VGLEKRSGKVEKLKSGKVRWKCVSWKCVACAAVAIVLIAAPLRAQVPAPGVIAFTGARVVDGTGSAPIEQATIVITNGRITAIGPSASVMPPAGAMIVNVAGKTIIPGLINSHAHIDPDISVNPGPYRDEMVRRLKTYAIYGVTSVMTLGFETYDEPEGFYLRDLQRLGIGPVATDAPRLYASGRPILFRPGPTGSETPDDARIDVQRHVPLRADFIKLHLDGVAVDLKPDVFAAAVDEAHKHNLSTAVHIIYLKDAKMAIERGVDVIAHSVRDLDIDAATIAEMKRRNVALIPTLVRDRSVFIYENLPDFFKDPFFLRGMPAYKHEVDVLSDLATQQRMRTNAVIQASKPQLAQGIKNLKPLLDAGIPIAMGSDSGSIPDRNLGRWVGYNEHVELEMMVGAGMTPMQALVSATSTAARVMKIDGAGSLATGKWADLVVLNANPLTDIKNTRQIDSVYIGGRKVNMTATAGTN